jgi:hypothetical protein
LSAHYQLETIPGFEFLRCADETPAPLAADEHCGQAFCCAWESGQYHTLQDQPQARPELVVMPQAAPSADPEDRPALEIGEGLFSAVPPDLVTSWQFSSRAALPIRAPTLVS